MAEIIAALEGPIALMECSAGPGHCDQESICRVREPWQRINEAIHGTLLEVTLASLVRPGGTETLSIGGEPRHV